uniref:Uncharacterized protein n=1 Tax=Arundo donax TaxID=35708 RepID=A0A0A8ZZY9_ARUDO
MVQSPLCWELSTEIVQVPQDTSAFRSAILVVQAFCVPGRLEDSRS